MGIHTTPESHICAASSGQLTIIKELPSLKGTSLPLSLLVLQQRIDKGAGKWQSGEFKAGSRIIFRISNILVG